MFGEEDDAFTMGSKDLSMIDHIAEMIESGVDSFKIEGQDEEHSLCGNGCQCIPPSY